ncbi:MAG: POTRA domain-containing protein [Bacteroidota bacterium]
MQYLKTIYTFCLVMLMAAAASAQNVNDINNITAKLLASKDSSAKIIIHNISISGNKKTKEYNIRREIQLKPGDSVSVASFSDELQKLQQQVYNTNLFLEVKPELTEIAPNTVDINLALKERWYIFPIPKFQLIDRNINEWIQKYDADLDRVVYGVKFTHYNLTGHRDLLRLTLLNGFTRNISFTYFKPVSEKKLNNGFSVTGGIVQNREFIYKIDTVNKPVLFNNGNFSRENYFIGVGYNFRKNIMGTHYFNVVFNHVSVVDSLVYPKYNPNYFKDDVTHKNYVDFSYTYRYINTNNAMYPLRGTVGSVRLLKRGFGFSGGINMFSIEGSYNKYWALNNTWYASTELSAKTTLPFNQPYINQRSLGYSDVNLRGLELYVVDGVAFGLVRNTLKKKLFTINIKTPFRSDKYHVIPFTVFAKTYGDLGVVYNKDAFKTSLNNKLLYTGGFGIDILSIYDVNLRIEYSFNQLGKNGLFLQAQSGL